MPIKYTVILRPVLAQVGLALEEWSSSDLVVFDTPPFGQKMAQKTEFRPV